MKNTDEFGVRMKAYEAVETARRLDPALPIYARLDGRSFSTFTRGMRKPFDTRMSNAMIETASYLVDETNARIGYTQSDEISLVWLAEAGIGDALSDIFFSGKLQKMTSVLASMAAAKFATVLPAPEYAGRLPHFDCRVFQLPTKSEAANAFLWRTLDARKNAISAAAQALFSPRALHGKNQKDMIEMLAGAGVAFDDYPSFFKDGTFLRRVIAPRQLTDDELARIPEAYRPDGPVMRSSVIALDLPPFRDVQDRESVIFG